jgi:choice-of-anchor C domain-containing protein
MRIKLAYPGAALPLVAILGVILFPSSFFARQVNARESSEPRQVNLLINGSFEDGPDTNNPNQFVWLNEGDKQIKGWTVSQGQLSYVGSYWEHADGKHSLDMHGGPGFGGIKQTFATKKGQKYRVIFAMAGNPLGMVSVKKLGVRAAGQEVEFTFDTTGKTIQEMGWTTQVWDFVARESKTTLEFRTHMTEDGDCGPALDRVSVWPVED